MSVVTRFPTQTANNGVDTEWTSPNNMLVSDETDATATLSWAANGTDIRGNLARLFDFDSVIPVGATIDAVKIITYSEGEMTGQSGADLQVNALVNSTPEEAHAVWGCTEGSPAARAVRETDITADRSWTRADLLDSQFEVNVRARGFDDGGITGGGAQVGLDYVAVEVTYSGGEILTPQILM